MSGGPLYQPNLMCNYHLTQNHDLSMRVLTVVNKDKIGICDEQVLTSLGAWAELFMENLHKHKSFKMPEYIPEASVEINFSNSHHHYSIVVMSLDKNVGLSDSIFGIILGNFVRSLANKLGDIGGKSDNGTTPSIG